MLSASNNLNHPDKVKPLCEHALPTYWWTVKELAALERLCVKPRLLTWMQDIIENKAGRVV